MKWKLYDCGSFEKEFWDAYDDDGVAAHVLRLGNRWCAWASVPSKYGNPAVNHGGMTDFLFETCDEAMAKAELLAAEARKLLQAE